MIRVRDAADLLGVSDDTVRRWIDDGTLPVDQDQSGRKVIPGRALAEFAVANSGTLDELESRLSDVLAKLDP